MIISGACTKNLHEPAQPPTIKLPSNGAAVITANNQFGFDFFHQTLSITKEDQNTLISPLSIYLALSMLYNGADNATKDAMENTLLLSGIDLHTLN